MPGGASKTYMTRPLHSKFNHEVRVRIFIRAHGSQESVARQAIHRTEAVPQHQRKKTLPPPATKLFRQRQSMPITSSSIRTRGRDESGELHTHDYPLVAFYWGNGVGTGRNGKLFFQTMSDAQAWPADVPSLNAKHYEDSSPRGEWLAPPRTICLCVFQGVHI